MEQWPAPGNRVVGDGIFSLQGRDPASGRSGGGRLIRSTEFRFSCEPISTIASTGSEAPDSQINRSPPDRPEVESLPSAIESPGSEAPDFQINCPPPDRPEVGSLPWAPCQKKRRALQPAS